MACALIAAHALLSALGTDAAVACAAAHAGLVRARALEGLEFISAVDGAPAPVIGHAVPLVTRGFEGDARLERLLATALTDLRTRLPEALAGEPMALYLSMPSPTRTLTGAALLADDDSRAALAAELHEIESEGPLNLDFAQKLAARAAAQAGFGETLPLRRVSLAGHAGAAQCLAAALADLERGEVRLAIVGGVDSLLDEATIEWLNATQRLKLSDMPVGLLPGEACALLALARSDAPLARGDAVALRHVGLAAEERTLLSGSTSVGIALAEVLAGAAETAGWPHATSAWLIGDMNGEAWRANEWGHALVRLCGEHAALADAQLWTPAESFGDTGAASALLGACVALAAFERRYAPQPRVVIASSSEAQLRSAIVLDSGLPMGALTGGVYGRP